LINVIKPLDSIDAIKVCQFIVYCYLYKMVQYCKFYLAIDI